MELGLERLPWYGQIGTFALVSVVGLFVFQSYWAQPRQAQIAQQELALNQARIDVAQARQTARRLPDVRAALVAVERDLDELSAVLPQEKDAGSLLRQLQALAVETNLSLRAFTPQASISEGDHAAWPSRLELVGTYHNLGRFFDRVSKLSQVIHMREVTIRAVDPPRTNATITAECTATTFVLNDLTADAEEAPPEA